MNNEKRQDMKRTFTNLDFDNDLELDYDVLIDIYDDIFGAGNTSYLEDIAKKHGLEEQDIFKLATGEDYYPSFAAYHRRNGTDYHYLDEENQKGIVKFEKHGDYTIVV